MSIDVAFLETTPFFYAPLISTSQGEKDNWLVYHVTNALTEQSDDVSTTSPSSSIEHHTAIVPSETAQSALTRPPIIQVYSRR